jgi:CPA2 family monovalent cation:H+ antiporter-2
MTWVPRSTSQLFHPDAAGLGSDAAIHPDRSTGKGEPENLALTLALALAKSLGAVLLICLWGRKGICPLFLFFAMHHQPDLFMALILLRMLGIVSLTPVAGLSITLGASLASLVLAETKFRYEVELMVEPFKGLLTVMVFMTVGMRSMFAKWPASRSGSRFR